MGQCHFSKPYYPHQSIGSIEVLARSLGVHPTLLIDISKKTSESYTSFEIEGKNNKKRLVYEPKFELKKIQKKINKRIMEKVEYPQYLTGSIRDTDSPRDYVRNASVHSGAHTIVKVDIKNFFLNIRADSVENIFKNFFRFPEEVSSLLANLTTLNGRVPQGGCTSSYIANLLFFNSEYKLYSDLKSKGITYTRLLDDITMSSVRELTDCEVSEYIKMASAICTKNGLKLNNKKTEIDHKKSENSNFMVTGVWVKHKNPKILKKERRFARLLVYIVEQEYKKSPCSEEYHKLWNRASGKVAKLTRLKHKQAKRLRSRLQLVLPIVDADARKKMIQEVKKLCHESQKNKQHRIGHIRRVNKSFHDLGVLSRTDKSLAKDLRSQLKNAYKSMQTVEQHWD